MALLHHHATMPVSMRILENGNAIGVLPAYNENCKLFDHRSDIENELDLQSFIFIDDQGEAVNKDHKNVLDVRSKATSKHEDNGQQFLEIEVKLNGDKPSNNNSKATANLSSDPSTSFLKSPTSWEIRRMKIYSEKEIVLARGFEKERRKHWNKMAKKLCKETSKTREQIGIIINSKWQVYQASKLLEANKTAAPASHVKSSTLKP